MPSNIFATTGTSVSIMFVDKSKKDENIILVDASNLGKKIKDNGIQRTILTPENISLIENTFLNKDQIDDFSIIVRKNDIISKKYSFAAGQFFKFEIKYNEISMEEFKNIIKNFKDEIESLQENQKESDSIINKLIEEFKYDDK
jgi:type I restriction enzyme M protein